MEGFVVTPEYTYAFFLVLLRTSSMLVSAPLLSHKGIPAYTKVGFAVFFSLVLVILLNFRISHRVNMVMNFHWSNCFHFIPS